jgi:non-ribosomal peptide synthetase component F
VSGVPIGLPLSNLSLHVLDRSGAPVPLGACGELAIGGDGLAQGYWNRPELTAEAFRPHPWAPGERLYRTGDLVRRGAGGAIEILGRLGATT